MNRKLVRLKMVPISKISKIVDVFMIPIMYILVGTFKETPQKTHFWNNTKLMKLEVRYLDTSQSVLIQGIPSKAKRWFGIIPRFHIPILGDWRNYVVLEPKVSGIWYVGWISTDVIGITQIQLTGPVRLLRGQEFVTFFGVNADGYQIPLKKIGFGVIGNGGPFAKLPLL